MSLQPAAINWLTDLPYELWEHFIEFLTPAERLALGKTCKTMAALCFKNHPLRYELTWSPNQQLLKICTFDPKTLAARSVECATPTELRPAFSHRWWHNGTCRMGVRFYQLMTFPEVANWIRGTEQVKLDVLKYIGEHELDEFRRATGVLRDSTALIKLFAPFMAFSDYCQGTNWQINARAIQGFGYTAEEALNALMTLPRTPATWMTIGHVLMTHASPELLASAIEKFGPFDDERIESLFQWPHIIHNTERLIPLTAALGINSWDDYIENRVVARNYRIIGGGEHFKCVLLLMIAQYRPTSAQLWQLYVHLFGNDFRNVYYGIFAPYMILSPKFELLRGAGTPWSCHFFETVVNADGSSVPPSTFLVNYIKIRNARAVIWCIEIGMELPEGLSHNEINFYQQQQTAIFYKKQ